MTVMDKDKAQAIRLIRQHMAALGYDTSAMTDEQLEQGVLRFAEGMRKASVTAKEMSDAFARIAKANVRGGSNQDRDPAYRPEDDPLSPRGQFDGVIVADASPASEPKEDA